MARSVTLSSERLGIIAKMDLVEGDDGTVTPVDTKKGKRPHVAEGAYEPERVQVCAQALILEDAGYGEQLNSIDAQRDAARQAGQESGARRQASPFAEEDQLRLERRAARRIDNLRRSRAEGAAVEEESADEVPFSRAAPGRFQPLPGAPKIKGATGPDKRLVRIAERYAKANGIELRRQAGTIDTGSGATKIPDFHRN